ncbi:hypothetical protein AB0O75_35520 [Streptomyces sp. NPDC088921]|uniref:hypothetical protein n=1 Tax=unclassified Streptomyces TaxID=2593676 RepID=UPI003438CAD3
MTDHQQAPAPQPEPTDSRRKFVKKGAVAAIVGAVSGAARFGAETALGALFGDGS